MSILLEVFVGPFTLTDLASGAYFTDHDGGRALGRLIDATVDNLHVDLALYASEDWEAPRFDLWSVRWDSRAEMLGLGEMEADDPYLQSIEDALGPGPYWLGGRQR